MSSQVFMGSLRLQDANVGEDRPGVGADHVGLEKDNVGRVGPFLHRRSRQIDVFRGS